MRVATLAALTGTVLLLSACTQGSTSAENPPSGPTSSVSPEATDGEPSDVVIDSPLQAYRLTERELTTVSYARTLLIRDCMRDFGFEYPEPEPFSKRLQRALISARIANDGLYGVTDANWVRKYGYGFPPGQDTAASPEDEAPQSPAFTFALYGTKDLSKPVFGQTESPGEVDGKPIPGGGCAGEAARQLDDTNPDISTFGLAHTLFLEDIQKRFAGEAHRAAVAEWNACLATEGYQVTDFGDTEGGDIGDVYQAREAAGDEGLEALPSQSEVALALADVKCKDEVDFVSRLKKAQKAIDEQTIKDNQLALQEDRKRLDAQVAKATKLVEGAN